MIIIKGRWYDGRQSAQVSVVMKAYDNGALQVEPADGGAPLFRQSRFSAQVSDRVGNTPRFLTFPDGTVLETEDNTAVDQFLQKMKSGSWTRWVHRLESRKRYVLLAGLLVLLIGAGMVRYGFPAAAKKITAYLPLSIFEQADRQALSMLDRIVFKSSELPSDTEKRVRTHFQCAIEAHAPLKIRLLFRKGSQLGPNAFALPGGTIVFTDELVQLAEHDDELLGIMAHEIGHLVYQHAMRRLVQDSLLSFSILALTGDASGVSEIFFGLPVVLTELAYSRDFEREADRYALNYLQSNAIPPGRFADILTRLDKRFKEQEKEGEGSKWTGYLATHPPTTERIKKFR